MKRGAIPTNIITGFLGVGKTTTILHLLKSKPAEQRWAVLVNEFGEIGVDGGLLNRQSEGPEGVFVREVPGGCMCCASGLPMQVALNSLLISAKPDRLLIEPTGLGHPKEVLETLSGKYYQSVLRMEQIITLVNARHLADARYTDHVIFNQQIEVANVIVGNKADLYQPEDRQALEKYVAAVAAPGTPVVFASNGIIDHRLLHRADGGSDRVETDTSKAEELFPPQKVISADGTCEDHSESDGTNSADSAVSTEATDFLESADSIDSMPECGYLKKLNHGDGFASVGWRFREDKVFARDRLFSFLNGIDAHRAKGVINTDQGVLGYNKADGTLSEIPLFGGGQSCIEIISLAIDDAWEADLLRCLEQ